MNNYKIWGKLFGKCDKLPVYGKSVDVNEDSGIDHLDLNHLIFSKLLILLSLFCAY